MHTIDLSGPDGNVFNLIGLARTWCRQMNRKGDRLIEDMMSGDYANAVARFEAAFCEGPTAVARLINKPGDLDEDDLYPEDFE